MSGTSSVGQSGVYEAGDQRNVKKEQEQEHDRYHEGQSHSHQPNDPKDQRSIANRLAREEKRETEPEGEKGVEVAESKKDATLPAKNHGNEPSKGAKIDKEIADEEAEMLAKKDAKK